MSVKQRIIEFAKHRGITQREFCRVIGVSETFVSSMRTSLQPDKMQSIAQHYPDLNITWLMTGDGNMLLDEAPATSHSGKSAKPNPSEDIAIIPLLPIYAQGGSLNDFFGSVRDIDCEHIISPIRGVDFAITVSGESMSPEFPNGSKILIKKINEKAFIEWGRVYVLDTCNGAVVKTLEDPKKEGCVLCTSLNPDPKFSPFFVNTEDIIGMYRVMMCMTVK